MTLIEKYNDFYADDPKHKIVELSISGWPRSREEAIVAVPGTGQTVLDVGCGDGSLLYQFRHRYALLVGLEISPARLSQARRNLASENFRPILASAEEMREIASESIDRIISADAIEHIPDVYAATSEMYRVMKEGGTLVMNTPNVAYIKRRALLLCGRFPSTSQPNEGLGSDILFDGGHLHYFTFRSLELLLRKAGFHILQRVGYGRFGHLHRLWPGLTSVGVQLVAVKV